MSDSGSLLTLQSEGFRVLLSKVGALDAVPRNAISRCPLHPSRLQRVVSFVIKTDATFREYGLQWTRPGRFGLRAPRDIDSEEDGEQGLRDMQR